MDKFSKYDWSFSSCSIQWWRNSLIRGFWSVEINGFFSGVAVIDDFGNLVSVPYPEAV